MNTSSFKMGSLFDGSGGFPLASALCGIEPVWASEIEPFPIKVTKARFPNMKHYGDISKINVDDLETVDLITGGSPCQDMSVAGKRQGMSKKCPKCAYTVVGNAEITDCPECGTELEYTRSGLFMDQIRIVKEMRKKDELEQLQMRGTVEHIRPRFMLWENVVGAFSSNGGEDFRAVLEETAKIKDPTIIIPRPPKGKWNSSGCIVGDGYSIAWRVLDAQYWGVPQRRRRIALVADFGGQCAGEILFERDGLSRNFTESRKAWQGIAGNPAQGIGEAGEPCHTLGTDPRNYAMIPQPFSAGFCAEQSAQTRSIGYEEVKSPTLRAGVVPAAIMEEQYSVDFGRTADRIQMNADKAVTLLGEGGGGGAKTGLYCLPKHEPQKYLYCMATQQGGAEIAVDLAPTLTAAAGMSGNNQPVINQAIPIQDQAISNGSGNGLGVGNTGDKMYTLMSNTQHGVAYSLQGNMIGREDHNGPQGSGVNEDISFTLNATDRHAVVYNKRPENVYYRMEAFGQYSESDSASTLKGRDYKDATDLVAKLETYQDKTETLMASGYSKLGTQEAMNDMFIANEYIVRRLTPLECSRLQGFPDWWTDGLQIENPTEEDLIFWREVFETHREIVTGASKAKTDNQIIKWLREEPNDGAKYKCWGNGIALPCFLYVIEGIKEVLERTSNSNSSTATSEESNPL